MKLTHVSLLAITALVLTVAATPAMAQAPIVVTNASPAWQLIPSSLGPGTFTWGLPADLTSIGCGSENEPTCEPTGIFNINQAFDDGSGSYSPQFVRLSDPSDPNEDDIIGFWNTGGHGQVRFYSDPNTSWREELAGWDDDGSFCTEGPTGCVTNASDLIFGLSGGGTLTVELASDGEEVFDPFGYHADTSDQIRFTGEGAVVGTTPEPASLTLLGFGLVALAGYGSRRRKQS